MISYKCKICSGKLTKPEEENEIFWDNMQILMDALWCSDYKYGLNNIADVNKFKSHISGFNKICKYKCCSDKCRNELRKRAGAYNN